MLITAFLPCRKGSQRIPRKNIKAFAGFRYGLLEIKLNQLIKVATIEKIILSTDDEDIIKFASSLDSSKIFIDRRPEYLCTNETSTDDLIKYVAHLIPKGHILWTHVTSPILDDRLYEKIINTYEKSINSDFDSLMTVNQIKSFLWNEKTPINYDNKKEKWPRTQSISPIYDVNSAVFLASSEVYKKRQDRIGNKPYLYVLNKFEGLDIDWPEEFLLAEMIMKIRGFR